MRGKLGREFAEREIPEPGYAVSGTSKYTRHSAHAAPSVDRIKVKRTPQQNRERTIYYLKRELEKIDAKLNNPNLRFRSQERIDLIRRLKHKSVLLSTLEHGNVDVE